MINIEQIEKLDLSTKGNNFLKEVVDRIYIISKNDQTFQNKDVLKSLEDNIETLNKKILKQEELLVQSEKLEKKLNKRILIIDDNINDSRIELLDSLGSEL